MDKDLRQAAAKWDNYDQFQRGKTQGLSWWEAGSAIHEHINSKISGDPEVDWIEHAINTHFADRLPLDRCLVPGCGVGSLERRLASEGVFKQCDAADLSRKSIESARSLAAEQGFDSIHYFVADMNKLSLVDDTYDAIWISAAMHHFEALEAISAQMQRALKQDGLLILYEYVGPNRFQFPARQKEIANLCLQLLPQRYRTYSVQPKTLPTKLSDRKTGIRWLTRKVIDKLQDGTLLSTSQRYLQLRLAAAKSEKPGKAAINFPSERAVISDDPSEAIRSADIMRVLPNYFEIIEHREWGGNIVQFLLHGIAGNFRDEDECSQDLVRMLLNIEDTLIKCGEFRSDFTYIVARPKKSPKGLIY